MWVVFTNSLPRSEAPEEKRRPLRRAQGLAGPPRQTGRHRPSVPLTLRPVPEGPRVPHHRPLRSHLRPSLTQEP